MQCLSYFRPNPNVVDDSNEVASYKAESLSNANADSNHQLSCKPSRDFSLILGEQPTQLTYLGFVFDGETIQVKQAVVSKYYSRMHKKAKHYARQKVIHLPRKPTNLYTKYTPFNHKHIREVQRLLKKHNKQGRAYKKLKYNSLSYLIKAQKILNLQDSHVEQLFAYNMQKVAKTIKKQMKSATNRLEHRHKPRKNKPKRYIKTHSQRAKWWAKHSRVGK